jgi:DNA-binding response OmpR family regulator
MGRILHRTKQAQKNSPEIEINEFKIGKYLFNYKSRALQLNKDERRLTSKEAELLRLLCENSNKLLERTEALSLIWKEDNYFTSRSMDVYITKLRSYLKEDPSIQISNVHGLGFKLTF